MFSQPVATLFESPSDFLWRSIHSGTSWAFEV